MKVKDKIRATLPEALHDDLHWGRNQFLHGMPIRPTMPRYRQSNRYNPAMSRIWSMSSGSFDSLKVSLRWGCRPNARQMRLTDDRLIRLALATSRTLQWVAPRGVVSSARITTRSICSSVIVRGAPGYASHCYFISLSTETGD